MPDLLSTVTEQVIAGLALLAAVSAFGLKLWRTGGRVKDFDDDWNGRAARPGHARVPGVIESISLQAAAITSLAKSQESLAETQAGAMKDQSVKIAEISALVKSTEYHSRPNGGGSAYDHLLGEVVAARSDLAKHVEQAAAIHDEQAAAIAFLAENREAVDDLADAIGPAIRATPHECDLKHVTDEEHDTDQEETHG